MKRTERGWAGHFIGRDNCRYHRNTLLEHNERFVVISTVGRYCPPGRKEFVELGCGRHFETLAFEASATDKYHDASGDQISLPGQSWSLPRPDQEIEADAMHEEYVEAMVKWLTGGNN